MGGAQRLAHRGRVAVVAVETDLSDIFQRQFEPRRPLCGRDVGGRKQPADVAKASGAKRRLAPVRQPVARRRKIGHQVARRHPVLPVISLYSLGPASLVLPVLRSGTAITFQRGSNQKLPSIDTGYNCQKSLCGKSFAGKRPT